jgi:hypothetical protein
MNINVGYLGYAQTRALCDMHEKLIAIYGKPKDRCSWLGVAHMKGCLVPSRVSLNDVKVGDNLTVNGVPATVIQTSKPATAQTEPRAIVQDDWCQACGYVMMDNTVGQSDRKFVCVGCGADNFFCQRSRSSRIADG